MRLKVEKSYSIDFLSREALDVYEKYGYGLIFNTMLEKSIQRIGRRQWDVVVRLDVIVISDFEKFEKFKTELKIATLYDAVSISFDGTSMSLGSFSDENIAAAVTEQIYLNAKKNKPEISMTIHLSQIQETRVYKGYTFTPIL